VTRRIRAQRGVGLVALLAALVVVAAVAFGGPPGAFDTSFGGNGYQTVGFGGLDRATHVAITPDGRIVMIGTTNAGGNNDFAVTRLTASGGDDLSFSGDGQTILGTAPGADDVGAGVVVTADERIVVSGTGGLLKDFVTKRLGVDGSVDASFAGGAGISRVDFGGNDLENQMIAQPDGKLVLVGGTDNSGGGDFAIARLNANGTPDTGFSGDGRQTVDFGGADAAIAVANAPGGKLVVVGQGGGGTDMAVTRLNSDGSVDTSFGTAGKARVSYGGNEAANGVIVGSDGSIVIDGSTSALGSGDFAVAKLTAAGALDPSFSGDGRTTLGYGAPDEAALALARQQNGKLVVMGTGNPDHDFIVARLQPDGSADGGFGTAGTMVVDFGGYEFDGDVALQPDGRIVIAGSTNVADAGDMAIARLEGDPVAPPPTTTTTPSTTTTPATTTPPPPADCVQRYRVGILDIKAALKKHCFKIVPQHVHGKTLNRASVTGPVDINGLRVLIPSKVTSVYQSEADGGVTLGIAGRQKVSVTLGSLVTKEISLEKKIPGFPPSRPKGLVVYHLVNVDETANAPLLGLPVRGALAIDLRYRASSLKVGLGLPFPFSFNAGRTAQGDVFLAADNDKGLHYDGLRINVPNLWLGPLFVNSLGFSYQKSTKTWSGTGKVTLPGSQIVLNASGPPEQPPDFGFGIKNGKFDHAGFGVDFLPPTQPDLFPPFNSVLLSHIGASVALNPLRLTGTIGINAAHVVDEDGVLLGVFATRAHPYTMPESVGSELAPLANRTFDRFSLAIAGTAKLKVPALGELPLLNAYGLYEYPDYFEFGGGFKFDLGIVSIDGNVGGFAYPTKRAFNLQGGVNGCIKIKLRYKFVKFSINPCVTVGAVVSSKGLGFCTTIPVHVPIIGVTVPITIGAGYIWGGKVHLMAFSCDYGPYAEKSPLARRAAAGGGYAVNVPAGLPSAMFRIHGNGGEPPDLKVLDPHGTDVLGSADAVALDGTDDTDTVVVAVRHPAAGRWTFVPNDGSAPVTRVDFAHGLPPVALKARVTGKGPRRVLRYRMNPAAGRSVTFLERGPATSRVLGVGSRRVGTIKFPLGTGGAGRRSIVAVVSQNGAPMREQKVASYVAPRRGAPRPPGRVHATRKGGRIRISWGRSPGASRYEVLVRLSDKSQVYRVVRGRRVTVRDPFPAKAGTVSVNALSADSRRSATRTTRLAARRGRR
jgi:uncharacterized delta-60 repeat protein